MSTIEIVAGTTDSGNLRLRAVDEREGNIAVAIRIGDRWIFSTYGVASPRSNPEVASEADAREWIQWIAECVVAASK